MLDVVKAAAKSAAAVLPYPRSFLALLLTGFMLVTIPLVGALAYSAWNTERLAGLSRTVLVLAAASFFTDIASEMVAPLRLLFLVQVLGAPLAVAGLIGAAWSTQVI